MNKRDVLLLSLAISLFSAPAVLASECQSFEMTMHYASGTVTRIDGCQADGTRSYMLEIAAFGQSVSLRSDPETSYPGVDMDELKFHFACGRRVTSDGQSVIGQVFNQLRKGDTERAQELLLERRFSILGCES